NNRPALKPSARIATLPAPLQRTQERSQEYAAGFRNTIAQCCAAPRPGHAFSPEDIIACINGLIISAVGRTAKSRLAERAPPERVVGGVRVAVRIEIALNH